MLLSNIESKVWGIIEPVVSSLGQKIVSVKMLKMDGIVLQVMIEPVESTPQNTICADIEQCAKVSREIGAMLDVEDPIVEPYNLEVSSAGLERPLVTLEGMNLYLGHNVLAKLKGNVLGQGKLEGELLTATEDEITLKLTVKPKKTEEDFDGVAHIPMSKLKSLNLVYNW